MDKQIRGLGRAGVLPARAKSPTKNNSHAQTQSTANRPAPGAMAPPPPLEPRADSVTSPPPLVISPAMNIASTAPHMPVIAENAADAADAPTAPAEVTASAGAPDIPASAPLATATDQPSDVAAADPASANPPAAAEASPLADDQAPPSGRRKSRKTRPPDKSSEPPAKRSRGGAAAAGRRGRGRGRSSSRAPSEEALDDGADLVGLCVEVPGSIFFVDTPNLVYVCDVRKKDDRKRSAVEVLFRDDDSVYWFPVADVRRWIAEQQARDAAGTVPLVAGTAAAEEAAMEKFLERDDSEATFDVAEEKQTRRRKGKKKEAEKGVRKQAQLAAAAAAHEDGSSLDREGEGLENAEELAARALTDISAGGSGSMGHAAVDSAAAGGNAKATSRLQHAS